MNLTLELPQDVEAALAEGAQRQGVSIERYALSLLSAPAPSGQGPLTGAELVAFWKSEGVLGSRSDIEDSEAHARRVRESAQRRAAS